LHTTGLEILDDLGALERDPATAELIRSGRTMGCFYIESPSMRSLFQRMDCECYEDVVAASSIIRPGVAESGMMRAYIERRREIRGERQEARGKTGCQSVPHLQSGIQNPKFKICYLHPKLGELLAETYGVMVYQEDVIKVVHELGGLSLGEADILRRAMSGKAGGREAMESLTERFFTGCRQRGVPEPVIEELWRQIETFARFSFCKGHSAAFAVLSYQVAYLKAHYPAEFMAAVLSNGGGFYGAAAYIQECRRMGLRILGPDVNESEIDYHGKTEERRETTSDSSPPIRLRRTKIGWVRVGFAAIKNFPLDLARQIVKVRQERPFDGLKDFLRRVRPGHEATEKLIRVGAFDLFGIPRKRLFLELDICFRERTDGENEELIGNDELEQKSDRKQLFTITSASSEAAIQNPKSRIQNSRSDLTQRVTGEIELLGYGVSAHPLELLPEEVWRGTVAACDLRRHVGRRVTIIGWLIASKLVRTRASQAGGPCYQESSDPTRAGCPCHFMKFLSMEDLTGTFEVTLFPRAYRRFAPLTLRPGPFRVRGKVEDDQGALNLVADHIEIIPV